MSARSDVDGMIVTRGIVDGAPLVFVPRRQPKPFHRESVKLTGFVVGCACGTQWFMALEAENCEGARRTISSVEEHCCPDCRAKPQPSRMSRGEQIEDEVRMRFGATPQGGLGLGIVLPQGR